MKNKIKDILKLLDSNQAEIQELFNILSYMKLGEDKKLEGALYFCLNNNKISLEEIKQNYDENIFSTISILEKLDKINYSQQATEAENIRKMFFAITKDVRIIMLKIAFVVVDLRFVSNKSDESRIVAVKAYRLREGEIKETTTFKTRVNSYSTSNDMLPFILSKDEIAVCDIKTENGSDRTFYKDGALPLYNCTEDLCVVRRTENKVTVTSSKYIHAVEIECDGVCSDNYFSLLPGEEKTVTLKTVDGKPVGDYEITAYTIG